MYSIFFWILAFGWLIGIFVKDTPERPFMPRARLVVVLAMLVLLGLKTYPFNG